MSADRSRPNVLVFFTDDHAQWALGCYGHPAVRSPTIDWLSREGATFDNAFTPSPVCSPARATFWTGLFPSAHGIHDYIFEPEHDETHPGLKGQTTLGERLRGVGYQTALIGKWHRAHCNTPRPGFDRWLVNRRTQAHPLLQSFSDQGEWIERFGQQAPMLTGYATDWLETWAESQRDDPFFLFVGYTDTHTPLDCLPEELVAYYRADPRVRAISEPFSPAHGTQRFIDQPDPERARDRMCQYLAAVTHIDRQIAAVLDRLAKLGELDNTLIVYSSDHGHGNGYRGIQTKGNDTVPCNFLEPSIRVPLVMRLPGTIDRGVRHEAMVDHTDTFATLLDFAAAPFDGRTDGHLSPGASLLPRLRGESGKARAFQFGEYGNARMIRSERFKLIERYPGPNGHFPDELYDLRADPEESVNVIDEPEYAGDAATLRYELARFFEAHQVEARRGDRIAEQPPCNPSETWRLSTDVEPMVQR